MSDKFEQLREVETQWLMESLGSSIANLGYPVGMGVAPADANLRRAATMLFDRFIELSNALAAAPQHESQWQPIETAPKDGRRLLLAFDNPDADVVWTGLWANAWMVSYGKAESEPTHWMPLPMPPTLDPLPVDVDGEPYFPRDKKCKCGAYVRKGYACTCCWRVWK